MARPSHPPRIDYSNYTWSLNNENKKGSKEYKDSKKEKCLMKGNKMKKSTSILAGQNIADLSGTRSAKLDLWKVTDQIRHPQGCMVQLLRAKGLAARLLNLA
jgi:hypothetical protein